MPIRARPSIVAFGLLILLVGLIVEMSEVSILVGDLGVLVIVGALTLLAAILPSLWIGPEDEDRTSTRPPH